MLTALQRSGRELSRTLSSRLSRGRTRLEVAAGRYGCQHPAFVDALSPERWPGDDFTTSRRADRDRRRDEPRLSKAAAGPTPRRRSRLALSALTLGIATALVLLWGGRATGSEGPAAKASPDTASYVSPIFPALRSLRPFPRTASRWRSRRRWRQTTDFRAAYWRAARPCRSHAMRWITSSLVVARLKLDPVFFAGRIRSGSREHLGDSDVWWRATACRRQRGGN